MGSPVPAGTKLDRYGLNPSYRCSISELVYVFQMYDNWVRESLIMPMVGQPHYQRSFRKLPNSAVHTP